MNYFCNIKKRDKGTTKTKICRVRHTKNDRQLATELLQAKTSREKAAACLIFAGFEQEYRTGELLEIAAVILKGKNRLRPSLKNARDTLDDLANLIETIPSIWLKNLATDLAHTCCFNATFPNNTSINADAQQIVADRLIKCFTTLKSRPFNRQHFWQQIAYVLLDYEDDYKINTVCWYYSRQKTIITYDVASLFKDLPSLRQEFHDFLNCNYGCKYAEKLII